MHPIRTYPPTHLPTYRPLGRACPSLASPSSYLPPYRYYAASVFLFSKREQYCALMSYMLEDVGHRTMKHQEKTFWSALRQSAMNSLQLLDVATELSEECTADVCISKILLSDTTLAENILQTLEYEEYCFQAIRLLRHCLERGGRAAVQKVAELESVVEAIVRSLNNNFATVPDAFREIYHQSNKRTYNLAFAKAGLQFLIRLAGKSVCRAEGECNDFAWEFGIDEIQQIEHFASDLHEARRKHALDTEEAIDAERFAREGGAGSGSSASSGLIFDTPEVLLKQLLGDIKSRQAHKDFDPQDRAAVSTAIKKFLQQQARWEKEQQDPTLKIVQATASVWGADNKPRVVDCVVHQNGSMRGKKRCAINVRWNQVRGHLREVSGELTMEIQVRSLTTAGGGGAAAGAMLPSGETAWVTVDGPRHFEEAKSHAVQHCPPGGEAPHFEINLFNPARDDLAQLTDLPPKHKFLEMAQKFYQAQGSATGGVGGRGLAQMYEKIKRAFGKKARILEKDFKVFLQKENPSLRVRFGLGREGGGSRPPSRPLSPGTVSSPPACTPHHRLSVTHCSSFFSRTHARTTMVHA